MAKMIKKIKNNIFILAFLFGVLSAFCFAPFNFFIAAMISFSGFFLLLEKVKDSRKSTFLLGFVYGYGYFLSGIYWIAISLFIDFAKFGWLIPFALTIIPSILALYFAFFAISYQKICKKLKTEFAYQKIIIFAIIFVIFEILRSHLFTGFSWNLIGYSLMFSDYTTQLASFFGIFGLSFLAIIFSLSLILLYEKSRQNYYFLALIIVIFISNFLFGFYRINSLKLEQENFDLRIVQGNILQSLKWDARQKYHSFKKHIDISKMQENQNIKAIIWPETAVPYAIGIDQELILELKNVVNPNSFLITGALRVEFEKDSGELKEIYNSIFAVEKNEIKYYDKHHLVPFGEYVPLQKFLPFVEKITGGGVGFSSGSGAQTLEMKDLKFSPLVCYEVIFPDKIIDRKNRPDLLVNLTNDAWFKTSSGPYQHLLMSRMRAIEYGISLVRAANTGISAYIDPFGRIVDKIELNDTGFFDVKMIKPLNETIFSQFKYFVIILILLCVWLVLLIDLKLRKIKKNEKFS